mgnify:CR=1 FL=1
MEIKEIYPPYLYAVQYDGESRNEFRRLFHEWNDKEFLISFFREHIDYLDKDIWAYLENNPEKAASSVAFDANRLERNCYLIVYGGLKLAKTIQESPVLKDYVFAKIDWVLQYLKREGIGDNEDL